MRDPKENQNFCVLPFMGVCIEAGGRFRPCCKYQKWDDSKSAMNESLSDILKAESYQRIRKDMIDGVQHKGCHRCWSDESKGIESMRQSANRDFMAHFDFNELKPRVVDFGFGNSCNASCVTCDSHSSSHWETDDAKLSQVSGNPFGRVSRNSIQEVEKWSEEDLRNIVHITHAQNEVLASKNFLLFLEKLETQGILHEKSMNISTNSSIWPSEKILGSIKKMKKLTIQLSIDAYGSENEYIRYPLKWKKVENTAMRWIEFCTKNDIKISCRSTLSVYNILSQEKLFDWWLRVSGGSRFHLGYCWYPSYLSPMIFAKTVQPLLTGIENKIPEMSKLLKADQDLNSHKGLFWQFTKTLDKQRGLSFEGQFPKLFHVLDPSKSSKFANFSI